MTKINIQPLSMTKINVKPLTINKAWRGGRRFKTSLYKSFEQEVFYSLPPLEIPAGKLQIDYIFGVSNSGFDVDNGVKPFTDIMQKKYGFNDNRIYKAVIEKVKVPKGQEFISFAINKIKEK